MACPEALIDHMLLTNKTFSFPLEERSWREFAYFSANVCHIFGPKNFKDAFSLFERAIVFSQIQSTHHFQKKQEIELDSKGPGQDPEQDAPSAPDYLWQIGGGGNLGGSI